MAGYITCAAFIAAIGGGWAATDASSPDLPALRAYVISHARSPEEYVVSKFADHDIVFIGEMHRIRHDPLLIQALIPRLYRVGVYNLGIEFANHADQPSIDRLITSPTYDEGLARQIAFSQYVEWGYKEYIDLYRAAWKLNHSLPGGAPRFRIVGLNYAPRWNLLTGPVDQMPADVRKAVFYNGDGDEYMGRTVLTEFVDQGKKALIYSGMHHAFTRYRQPVYNFETKQVYRLAQNRMGNVVYDRIGTRAMTIFLHSPWWSLDSPDRFNPPASGVIDAVMESLGSPRVGFDIAESPFAPIRDPSTYYSAGHDGFRLAEFCDGYVYQGPLDRYRPVTVDRRFVTRENLQTAIDNLPNARARKYYRRPADFVRDMRKDADIPRLFRLWGVVQSKPGPEEESDDPCWR